MGKYLKVFNNETDYSLYMKTGMSKFLPNVSYITSNPNKANFNKTKSRFSGEIDVVDTSKSYKLFSGSYYGGESLPLENIEYMLIDGIEVEPIKTYTFNTSGKHSFYVELKEHLTSCRELFNNTDLCSINLSELDTTNVINMSYMFNGCSKLSTINLNCNTINVTDMSNMFSGCSTLTSVNLSKCNLSNVTNMSSMFSNASSLIELHFASDLNENVDATNMLSGISTYSEGTIYYDPSYDTTLLFNIFGYFGFNYWAPIATFTPEYCTSLKAEVIDNPSGMAKFVRVKQTAICNGTDINGNKIYNKPVVSEIRLGLQQNTSETEKKQLTRTIAYLGQTATFNFTQGTYNENIINLIYNVPSGSSMNILTKINSLSKISELYYNNEQFTPHMKTSLQTYGNIEVKIKLKDGINNLSNLFNGCSQMTSIDMSNCNTSNVTNMSNMLYSCSKLSTLTLGNIDTSNVTNMSNMFYNCASLKNIDLSNKNLSNVINMTNMFTYCNGLTNINFSNTNTVKVTTMQGMFMNCTSLENINMSDLNTSNVGNVMQMFANCIKLSSLDLRNCDTSKMSSAMYMFQGCNSLVDLKVNNMSRISSTTNMFLNVQRPGTFLYNSNYPCNTLLSALPTNWTVQTYAA